MPPRKKRPLAVLDTNIICSAAQRKPGAAREVVNLWKRGFLQLVISDAIRREYLDVLARLALRRREMEHWTQWFLHPSKTKQVATPQNVHASRDPEDNPFLGAALTGGAEFIITRDNDLLELQVFEGVEIIPPAEFLERRRAGQNQRQ
ncbi:MAG: putative toxin-antitoxin system toxin component, PIN family [Armatimonadota bacterium]|nr:putative toxin-antitoxin system toxin component, PIN family [Armatimonadota bacterium]